MNRGALHKTGVFSDEEAAFMTRFWGDGSWEQAAYQNNGLFEQYAFKVDDDAFVRAFCNRLKNEARFLDTATPIPMKFEGKTLYYLILAGNHPTAIKKMRETASFSVKHPYAQSRKPDPSLVKKSVG